MKVYYFYILANKKNGTLYIGVTNNLIKRVFEHKNKIIKGFTAEYDVDILVYYEVYNDIYQAIVREKRVKRWKRIWKIALIEEKTQNGKICILILNNNIYSLFDIRRKRNFVIPDLIRNPYIAKTGFRIKCGMTVGYIWSKIKQHRYEYFYIVEDIETK